MDITKCHLCLLQPSQSTINTKWHFIVFLSCHQRILLLKVWMLLNSQQSFMRANLCLWLDLDTDATSAPWWAFVWVFRVTWNGRLTPKKLTPKNHLHMEYIEIKLAIKYQLRNVKMWNIKAAMKRLRMVKRCLIGNFTWMWSVAITKSARGHEGGCLCKMVLHLKQPICTYNCRWRS